MNGAVEKINEVTSKVSGVAGDVSAAREISKAIDVLNKWAVPGSRTSSEDAAKAFDKLFGGANPLPVRSTSNSIDGCESSRRHKFLKIENAN